MSVERKFKMALDETRLLMLGAQILFGFQLQFVFQETFSELPEDSHWLDACALMFMVVTIALLIAPGTQHRLVEHGQITGRLRHVTSRFASFALLPFSLSLGIDIYVALARDFGETAGIIAGVFFAALALLFWYGLEFGYRRYVLHKRVHMREGDPDHPTPLQAKIEQMLTEARIVLPGAQALLGFQLIVALNRTFSQLPATSKFVHAVALCSIAFCLVLLVAPAAFHRLTFQGEDSERFFRLGSALVTAALLPLALGIAGDVYVALTKIAQNPAIGLAASAFTLLLFLSFWYVQPLILRYRSPRRA